MRPTKLLAAMLCLLMAVSACTTNRATGEQSFTAFMSEEDEKRVGAEQHPQLVQQFGGVYDDPELSSYIRNIGEKLAALSEYPELDFQFFVLNDETVNAFALPGGYIYLSRGLIALAEDEAEVAGVIGHEIGHVTARHSAQRYSAAMATNIGLTAASVVGSIFGVPSGAGQLASFGAQAALQSYSRAQELEADRLGARYMTAAGYDPQALRDFFAKLDAQSEIAAKQAGVERNYSIMSTHPRTTDRIQQAAELARDTTPPNPIRNRNTFLQQVDGVIFGKDPDEGYLKGDTFIHPPLGFQYTYPSGFKVNNGHSAVEATNDNGTRIIFDMENRKAATGFTDLVAYVRRHWGPNVGLTPNNVEAIDVNGLPGATGSARADTNFGERDIRLIAIRGDRDKIFRFVMLTPPDQTNAMSEPLRRMTYSFRLLAPGEVDDYQPPRVLVRRVNAGETQGSLAGQMTIGEYSQDWFNALNLNVLADGLAAGERVKIIGN